MLLLLLACTDPSGPTASPDSGADSGADTSTDSGPDTGEVTPRDLPTTIEGFGAGATGGAGGVEVRVTTLADSGPGSLRDALAAVSGPTVVRFDVAGAIHLESTLLVPSHVTLDGQGKVTLQQNGLFLYEAEDVIVQDLSFQDIYGPGDAITIQASHDVLVLHCAFDNTNVPAGEADEFIAVVWGATDITIAWSRFQHNDKVFLIGNGDAPAEVDREIRVTLHDNWLEGNGRRHPFLRYGRVDEYNTFMADWSLIHAMTYGVRVADGGQVRLESVWMEQHSDWPALEVDPTLSLAGVGSPWIGAAAETDDARIATVNVVTNDDRLVVEDTEAAHPGEVFERPYPATIQPLDAAWKAGLARAVGPRR